VRRWLAGLAALALALAVPAAAQDAKPAWVGVWEGTVGNAPVRLCADTSGDGHLRGSYYYLSALEPISLSDYDSESGWTESAPGSETTAEWNFTEQSATALRGNWRQRRIVHPFTLRPVAWTEGQWGGPCSSDAFMAPRIGGGVIVREEAEFEGWRYTRLVYRPPAHFAEDNASESFSFPSERPGDGAINAVLEAYLPRGAVDDLLVQCSAGSISAHGYDGGFYQHVEPRMVSSAFLTVAEANDTYCGGAHPATWTTYRAFDRETGGQVDLEDWLGAPGSGEEARPLRAALRRTVVASWRRNDERVDSECRDVIADAEYWGLELTRDGISFSPDLPRVVMACGDPVLLTWADLEPFLDAEGRAGLARLRGE
jgi:hypothetical protein